MSIEKLIEANTAAVEENTATMKEMIALQKAALARLGGDDAPAKEEETTSRRGRGRSEASDDAKTEETTSRRSRREESSEDTGRASRRSAREDAAEDKGEKEETGRGRGRSRRGEDDDAKKDEPKKEETGSRRSRRGESKDDGKKKLTSADIRAEFAKFLEVDAKEYGDDAEKEEEDRRGFVEAIFDELGIDKATEVKSEDFDRVLDWLKRFADGENVRFDND